MNQWLFISQMIISVISGIVIATIGRWIGYNYARKLDRLEKDKEATK